jgi:hypothetical protein
LPPFSRPADVAELLGSEVRRVEDRQPAVEQLAGQLEVLRPDGGEVHRDVLAHRPHRELQRLAGPVRQRQDVVLALVADLLPGQGQLDDVGVLAGAGQRLVEAHAVPALGHLRSGHPEAQPEAAAGQRVQRRCGHGAVGRGAARDLEDRRARGRCGGLRGDEGQHRRGVGAVRLGDPRDGEAQVVGLLREREVVGVVAGTPVAEVEAELHAVVS